MPHARLFLGGAAATPRRALLPSLWGKMEEGLPWGKQGSGSPAWGRVLGSSEMCQSCVSVRLNPEEGSEEAPKRSRAGLPGRLLNVGTLLGGPGALLSPTTLGSERVTAPCQLGRGHMVSPAGRNWPRKACRHPFPLGSEGGESPGPLGNSPAHGHVCAPHTSPTTKPPETGLEDPLWGDDLWGWASLQGLPVI